MMERTTRAILPPDVCADLRELNAQFLAAQNAYQAALRVAIRMCKLDPSTNYDVNFITGIVTPHVEVAPNGLIPEGADAR